MLLGGGCIICMIYCSGFLLGWDTHRTDPAHHIISAGKEVDELDELDEIDELEHDISVYNLSVDHIPGRRV